MPELTEREANISYRLVPGWQRFRDVFPNGEPAANLFHGEAGNDAWRPMRQR
jgi:hypothetical protein